MTQKSLVELLVSFEWSWDWCTIERQFRSLGGKKGEQAGASVTYELPDGIVASALVRNGRVAFVRYLLEICMDPKSLSPEQREMTYRRFRQKYEDLVLIATQAIGAPKFRGSFGDTGFPEDSLAEDLSTWNFGDVIVRIEWSHQDRELPIVLLMRFEPCAQN